MKTSAVIVAAGSGKRMGAGINKVYMPLGDQCVLWHTVKAFADSGIVDEIVIVTDSENLIQAAEIVAEYDMDFYVILGGAERQNSVLNGISKATGDIVAVHDGARALITPKEIKNVIAAAEKYGAAALGVTPKDTVKTADSDGFISGTVERTGAYLIQTPQVFERKELIKAHEKAIEDGFAATDDCAVMERMGAKIKIVEGSYENIKLTTPEDIFTAERILKARGEK
ncbi:MAG: 2-C-methyl-D-erythritol 4-phosphate cytidylyltransferase [Eubacteriales bacterium]|nr:2-C-methyl-D-erythritol 4-phosphate cytidylyltransferase [Eubacteriales bacterium]